MEPIFFNDLDEETKKRALDSYKRAVYPELYEDYNAVDLVAQIGPFTDDDSLIREIGTLGIVFAKDGSVITDGNFLFIAYSANELTFVHIGISDIRDFKPHYLREIARTIDRSIL